MRPCYWVVEMNNRTKACDIPQVVKQKVWERDNHRCVICGNPQAMPNAHYISRAQGGLGIAQNIVTLCITLSQNYTTKSTMRKEYKGTQIQGYLKAKLQGVGMKRCWFIKNSLREKKCYE